MGSAVLDRTSSLVYPERPHVPDRERATATCRAASKVLAFDCPVLGVLTAFCSENAKRISGDIDSGLKLFKKLVDMHNSVNVRIGTNEKKYLQVATALQNPSSLCDAIKRSLALEESPNTFTDGPETIRIPYCWSAAVVSSAIILVACIMWWWNTRCSYILRRRD